MRELQERMPYADLHGLEALGAYRGRLVWPEGRAMSPRDRLRQAGILSGDFWLTK